MIAQIEVQQETARRLSELAAAEGLSVEPPSQLNPQEKAKAFLEWANSHRLSAPPLSDEAMSRKSIYTREDEQL